MTFHYFFYLHKKTAVIKEFLSVYTTQKNYFRYSLNKKGILLFANFQKPISQIVNNISGNQ